MRLCVLCDKKFGDFSMNSLFLLLAHSSQVAKNNAIVIQDGLIPKIDTVTQVVTEQKITVNNNGGDQNPGKKIFCHMLHKL